MDAIESMLQEIGGVPRKLTSDNPKCFATKADKYDPKLLQKNVALLTASSPAQINEIMNLRLERFTIDFLIEKIELLIAKLKKQSIEEKVDVSVTI